MLEETNLEPSSDLMSSELDAENDSFILDDGVMNEDQTAAKQRLIIGAGILLVLAAFLAVAWNWFGGTDDAATNRSNGPPPAPVAIATAVTLTMKPSSTLPGSVVSLRDSVVASETSGKVLSVALVGDVVQAGDSLAEIDPQNALQLVAQRKAELERLDSLYRYHSNYFARVGKESNDLGIPEITIAELKSNVETAKADVARAKASLVAAENDLARTSIKAPFAGRVVGQSIQPGEFAQVGSPVARLVDTQNLEVSARVPAALVQPLAAGTMLEIDGMGRVMQAPLRALVPVGDAISRTMELRVTLQESGLLVGSPVRVSLPTAVPREVVAVPRDAVILRPNQQYVFVVEDGTAYRREVTLGHGEADMIEVEGKVSVGDTIIIRGGERLRDGQKVTWQKSDEAATSESP